MNCFYRISAGTLLIVSTAIFISGCQTVHLGAEKGVQKPKISRVTDPIEFSYRFVEADSYGIDMHRVLKVSNLSGRRELLGSWCAKEDSSDNLSYHLFQLCKQQKGERVQAVGPRQWCFRPSDRTVLFEWSDIWGNDSRCLTGERRKISVNAPASADEVNNPYWEGYWKSFGVDRNYDLKSAKKEKQTLHTPKASQKTKTQKKLSQKEIEFRSLDTERKTVVLEGHKFQYGLLDNGTPVVVLFGEDTIQGQMAQGAEAALLAGTSSPQLRKLFSEAVAFAKRIHTEINTRVFDSTITEEVRRRIEGYGNVLIIGSGEGARKTADALLSEHSVTMTLRDDSKTFLIPPGTKHVPYDDRRMWIPEADVVISASSGLYHTLTEDDRDLVEGKLLFDLSTPPDLPSSFNAVRTEDLSIELPERNEVERKVRYEADKEVMKYLSWLERSGRAEDTALSAERIATASIRRSSEMIMKLGLDDEKEKAFRSSLMENIRKAALSELIVRKP